MNFTCVLRPATLLRSAALFAAVCVAGYTFFAPSETAPTPADREEVVFWHFWGGEDREVVADVVARFNASQPTYFVREVAMPGNNLDLKLFLSVAGGDPPDVVNQDDPIVADWAARGALTPLSELASPDEIRSLQSWLFPAARRLGEYHGELYALCNGLDIRLLYYNQTILEEHGLSPPQTIAELDHLADVTSLIDAGSSSGRRVRFGYVPDPRRLWAWGVVFGGDFFEEQDDSFTVDDPRIVAALDWMASYRRRFGAEQVRAFRVGDQSLPGKSFPLLSERYTAMLDGQWRIRDIEAFLQSRRASGEPAPKFGVCPLPSPPGGRKNAGWVNGNFFVVPRGANCPQGAWEFMKFWCGVDQPRQAAVTCIAGGWIPVSPRVVQEPIFREYLRDQPLFAQFVAAAGAEYQIPLPVATGAPYADRQIRLAGERAMYDEQSPPPLQLLQDAAARINNYRQRISR